VHAQEEGDDIVIGKYRVLHSDVLDEDRLLTIHLPRDYEETRLSYPVLYLLYGQDINNYFAEAVIISEKLGSTGEIPPVIIIGVANTNRYRDNLPAEIEDRPDSGGAANYLRFFEEELIPYVDKNYRTKNFRILGGPQAGAVFSLYALITKPRLFNAFISENPFMNPENAAFLFPQAEAFLKNTKSLKNFLYIKCEKNEHPRDLEFAENFVKLLDSHTPENFRYKVEIREPSGYFIAPLPFREGLRKLFSGHKLPENFKANTVKDIIEYYEELSGEYGFEVDPPSLMLTFEGDKLNQQGKTQEAIELYGIDAGLAMYRKIKSDPGNKLYLEENEFNAMGYRLMGRGRIKDAIAVFKLNVELYPDSFNVYDSLGEAYMNSGDAKNAIKNYKKSLELNPENANAKEMLKKLEKR
jgi:predicted alpha/beta superfamily hydrolase